MTKKDYIKIAAIFKYRVELANNLITQPVRHAHLRELAIDFCEMFEKDSEAFDRARFLKACGL